jgi:hypothetical protein
MVVGVKSEFRFVHTPLLHEEDDKTNLTPWNNVFSYLNQPHTLSEDSGAANTCLTHANNFFKNTFNLLKDKTIYHFTQ